MYFYQNNITGKFVMWNLKKKCMKVFSSEIGLLAKV